MITVVDVGATKVLLAQCGSDGVLRDETRFPTPRHAADFFALLHEHLQAFKNITRIVIGVPGIVDNKGVLLRCTNLPWRHVAIRQLLEHRYKVPVHVENDAKLAGLSEVHRLGHTPRLGLYLTVSTGIGDGIIIDGHIHPAFRTSESGHMRLQFNGEWQQWQQFASGSALVKHFGKEAHEFSRENEWNEVAERLSRGLLVLIPVLQPDIIIFGGSVGSYTEHFDDFLTAKLQPLRPFINLPILAKAHQPNEAVLYGCYYYATHHTAA